MNSLIRQLLSKVFFFPLRYIIFESNPDFSDNTFSVFREMQKRKTFNKYKFVWICRDKNSINKCKTLGIEGVSINNRIKKLLYLIQAKCILSCNSYIEKISNRQISIYLGHGIAIKSMNTYTAPPKIDLFIGLSEKSNEIMREAFQCDNSKFIITGYPRNDELFHNKRNLIDKIFEYKYEKILIWYPTYRQHTDSTVAAASLNALPLLHDVNNAKYINDYARKMRTLIILKPHFSQDLNLIKQLELSNIFIIDNNFFREHNLSSYELVGSCDALITDYSSIYFDYLLCNKPIAAIWEDIEEYKKNRGFCIDIDYYMKGAYKIYNCSDFTHFIKCVNENFDLLKNERIEINKLINYYSDSNNTERVLEIIEQIL